MSYIFYAPKGKSLPRVQTFSLPLLHTNTYMSHTNQVLSLSFNKGKSIFACV